MSGVVGILLRQGHAIAVRGSAPADAATDIQQMLARMRHRGPDGNSWWLDSGIALGHAWLNTTDEAGPGPLDPVLASPGVVDASIYSVVGETINPVMIISDRRGYVIAEGDTREQAIERADAAARLVDVEVEAA